MAPERHRMTETTPSRALHEAAKTRWQKLFDDDPDRSILYLRAEARTFTGQYLPRTGGVQRAQNWVMALHRYEAFWDTHSRTPRENTRNRTQLPADERRLGEWARYQRRFENSLCLYQRIRFDLSPAFVWDPHDSAWHRKWEQCVGLLEQTGRLPYLNSADHTEFDLARWLGRQMHHHQKGTLPEQRRRRLHELLELARPRQNDNRPKPSVAHTRHR